MLLTDLRHSSNYLNLNTELLSLLMLVARYLPQITITFSTTCEKQHISKFLILNINLLVRKEPDS